ncbi:MAG: mechanosensitive ion channel domain-containing protein [Bacteroidota bacterium]
MNVLDYIILNNSLRNIIAVASIILIVGLLRKWLSRYIASLLFIPIHQKWTSVEKSEFTGLLIKPLGRFLAVLVSILAIDKLNFPEVLKFSIYNSQSEQMIHELGKCLIIIYFIWLIQSFINFIALVLDINAKTTKDKRDDQLIFFFRDFIKAIIYIIGFLFILQTGFNVNVGALLTGLSIVGAALALAAKESIENLIASFIIFFDKPFFTGDVVKVMNITGTIEHIGLRSTRIRTTDQTLVTVPNKQMVDGIVDNWSMRSSRRAELKMEFSNVNKTFVIEQFIASAKSFLEKKNPIVNKFSVFLTDINKSSMTVTIEYFTIPFAMDDFLKLKQEIAIFIKATIETHELKLANATPDINIFNADSGINAGVVTNTII